MCLYTRKIILYWKIGSYIDFKDFIIYKKSDFIWRIQLKCIKVKDHPTQHEFLTFEAQIEPLEGAFQALFFSNWDDKLV